MKPPSSKRLNTTKDVDRISSLPELLIIHILSFLCIRDRIRTGVLSRTWKYIWTTLPNLSLDYGSIKDGPYGQTEFVHFVDKTLLLRNGANLESFSIHYFPYEGKYATNINLWAHLAARNCTHKFVLDFSGLPEVDLGLYAVDERYRLPHFLFTNTSVRELLFDGCIVNPIVPVKWYSLRKLTLVQRVTVSEEDIQKILAGSPVLEFLEIDSLEEGLMSLNLGNSSVKEFRFRTDKNEFHLWAPKLQSLHIGDMFSGNGNCKLMDITSLVEASLKNVIWRGPMGVGFERFARGLLKNILHVETLSLSTSTIQGVTKLYPKRVFSNCKSLTIDTLLWVTEPHAIASLLENCPQLELFIITTIGTKFWYSVPTSYQLVEGDKFWKSHNLVFNGLKLLKIIKFFDFGDYPAITFSFLEFLLEKASNLRRVVVNMDTQLMDQRDITAATQKLFRMQRSSRDAEFVVTEEMDSYSNWIKKALVVG